MKQNNKHQPQPTRDAIAVARVLVKLPVVVDGFSEPLATVLRETQAARGGKLEAFKKSAVKHGLNNADALIKDAKGVDPNATPEEAQELELITSDTILTTKYPDPVWAIPHLLPVGFCILAGAPKLGKSWLALQIALAVASGGVVLGETVQRGPVLYLALEDTGRRLQARMQMQRWTRGLPAEFLTLGQFENQIGDLTNGGGHRLAQQIERRGYRFVVIDTLSRAVEGDQNDVKEMTQKLTPIQEIAHAKNTAVLVVDHHRKGMSENLDAIGDILGSTAKGAMADTIWGLYRERGKNGAKLAITGREIEEKTLALSMDWSTGVWQCDGDADAIALTDRRQEILDVLADLGASQVDAIAKSIGQDRGNTFRRMQDLVNVNIVKRITQGRKILYALPDPMQTASLL